MRKSRVNLLLVSKRNEAAIKLRDDLERNPGYSVRFEETAEAAMALITGGSMNCVVFNFEQFGPPQVMLVNDIKKVAEVFQILIFADETVPDSVREIKGTKGVILIEKPLLNLEKDIAGLCERLIGGEAIYQRESKRHPTRQSVHVEMLKNGKTYEGFVTDISQNGACIELGKSTLHFDDKIRLTIRLDELGRKRIVSGEVRWSKLTVNGTVAGVRFIKNEKNED